MLERRERRDNMSSIWIGLLAVAAVFGQAVAAEPAAPSRLRCEYLDNPMGIDMPHPRFSWVLEHSGRGERQTAYQVTVSSAPDASTSDQWDSGKVANAQSAQVAYQGRPLVSGRTYYWRVRWWDKEGAASPWSRTARFDTGLLDRGEWKGRWIGGAGQLRKEFDLKARPARARIYLAGLGYYELRINGRKAGDHVLDPGWTTWEKRVLYTVYDVTSLLRQGPNAVAVMLGEGWYKNRALLMQLTVELEGGGRIEVVTGPDWKAHAGPIVSDSVYDGEKYDARLATPGWDRPGYDDAGWKPAAAVEAPAGVLSAQLMPPIRVVDTIVPLKLSSPRPGVWIYDLGQNFSGWVRLRVAGPRGARVRLRHSELLYDDGTLNVENLRRATATDSYTLTGGGEEEIYEPRFTYHGFRYVELTGYPGTPRLDSVRGRVVHSAVSPAGGFSSSKEILNRIQRMIVWGVASNLHGIPTDCNQRDERQGWLADAHLAAEAAMLNFDMAAFYTNFLRDIRDIQGADGSLTDTVPHRNGHRPADPAWGAAYPLLAWYMYEYYGDRRILEEHYDGIKAWADLQRTQAKDGILSYSFYGDWVPIVKTPGDLVSTVYYYWSADIVARVAEILGKTGDAAAYRRLAGEIAAAFNRRFLDPATGAYVPATQTAQILPMFTGIAPESSRAGLYRWLRDDIVYGHDTHLTTGILGAKYLMPLLTAMGGSDLAYDLAAQTTYPSWGYMAENGATTLWELWQNKTGPSMNSHNHPMFGSVGAWFYNALAGINPDLSRPGFERLRIAPQVVRDLKWVSGTVETLRGTVAVNWRRGDESLAIDVTIPGGSDAEIHIPKPQSGPATVTEGGRAVWQDGRYQGGVPGIASARETASEIIIEAGSGNYALEIK
jgi:alpha-L-rhamnosidase